MQQQSDRNQLKNLDQFPGWAKAPNFFQSIIIQHKFKRIADIGGGRLPRLNLDFIRNRKLDYTVFDNDQLELDRADPEYKKICLDIMCDEPTLTALNIPLNFDLVFSHMLLEHLPDPLKAHQTFYRMLRPGGLSIHMFPSRNNFPLFVNGLIPEAVSEKLLKILQPHRSTEGQEGKFAAFYKHCGPPTQDRMKLYENLGFQVVEYSSFVGHEYYKRISPLAAAERNLRKVIIRAGLPLISANLLILRKPWAN